MTRSLTSMLVMALLLTACATAGDVSEGQSARSSLLCAETGEWQVDESESPPELLNGAELARRLARSQEGREPRTLGTVVVMRVTREGTVDRACLEESSGSASFDAAALEGAFQARFSPASSDGEPRSAITKIPARSGVPRPDHP